MKLYYLKPYHIVIKVCKSIKRIVKSVLYNLPKSFLIWIILLLLYILLSGNVQASTVSEADISYLDSINISGTRWESSYIPTQNTEFSLECNISSVAGYTYLFYSGSPSTEIFPWDRTDQVFAFLATNIAPRVMVYMKDTKVLDTTDFPFGRMTISYYSGVIQVNDTIYNRISSDYWSYENIYPMTFNDRSTADFDYKIIRFTVKNNTNGSILYDYYPVKFGDSVGMYDLVNKNYEEISGAIAGSVISSPDTGGDTGGEKDYTNSIQGVQDSINNLQGSVDSFNQTQQETNDFLKDDTVYDSNFELPTVEVSDPTANFFDTLFTGLYGAFTSTGNKTISFKLINTDITINSSDFKFLISDKFTLLRYLLSTSWVVGIGMFILKDIRSMTEKIKNGDIEGIAKGDIKADMV